MPWLAPERAAGLRQRRVRSLAWLTAWGIFLLLLAGCAPKIQPDGRMPAQNRLGQEVLERWQRQADRYQALQGLAKVKLQSPDRSGGASQVLIARRPAQLRAETLGLFGTTMMVLVTDSRRLGVWVPPQNRYYEGRADAANMGRFLQIPVTPDLLVKALLYDVPVPEYVGLNTWALAAGGWLLELTGWNWRQELRFDARQRLVGARFFDQGEPLAAIRYGDFPEQEPFFPRRMELTLHAAGVEASLEFTELELNTDPDPGLFRLNPPADVERFDLDQLLTE